MSDYLRDPNFWTYAIRFLISNCLSYGVVFGASILKVPQLLSIWRHNSAEGVSLLSNELELFAYVISTSWGIVQQLQFKDYGENAFIFLQLMLLITLIARMQNKLQSANVVLATEIALFGLFAAGILPTSVHKALLSAQVLLNICSRVPQITMNYRNGKTGSLSFLTFFLAFGGGVARVLTTALNVPWNKGKSILLTQFTVAALLNAIVILQIIYYKFKSRKCSKELKEKLVESSKKI